MERFVFRRAQLGEPWPGQGAIQWRVVSACRLVQWDCRANSSMLRVQHEDFTCMADPSKRCSLCGIRRAKGASGKGASAEEIAGLPVWTSSLGTSVKPLCITAQERRPQKPLCADVDVWMGFGAGLSVRQALWESVALPCREGDGIRRRT